MSEQEHTTITRVCRLCGEENPSAFGKDKNSKDGLKSICLICARLRHKKSNAAYKARTGKSYVQAWKDRDPAHAKAIAKSVKHRFNRKNKIFVLRHYGGNPPRCLCCGEAEIDFLTIDHVNGGGREHQREIRRGSIVQWLWEQRRAFPLGFQVLCFNCNCAKGHYGSCPHTRRVAPDQES
jgi:hypothetical protein